MSEHEGRTAIDDSGGLIDWPRLIANACECNPHPVQIVISGTPTEPGDFHFTLSYTDRNGCSGEQNFTIHVQDQATAALLSLFQARPVDDGLELRWQFGDPRLFAAVELERGATALGPWTPVAGERREENGATVMVDRGVDPGRTYYYRLRATSAAGATTLFGPFAQTAGQAANAIDAIPAAMPTPPAISVPRNPARGSSQVASSVPAIEPQNCRVNSVPACTASMHVKCRSTCRWSGNASICPDRTGGAWHDAPTGSSTPPPHALSSTPTVPAATMITDIARRFPRFVFIFGALLPVG